MRPVYPVHAIATAFAEEVEKAPHDKQRAARLQMVLGNVILHVLRCGPLVSVDLDGGLRFAQLSAPAHMLHNGGLHRSEIHSLVRRLRSMFEEETERSSLLAPAESAAPPMGDDAELHACALRLIQMPAEVPMPSSKQLPDGLTNRALGRWLARNVPKARLMDLGSAHYTAVMRALRTLSPSDLPHLPL